MLARLFSFLLWGDRNAFATLYQRAKGLLGPVFTGMGNEATSAIYCLNQQAPYRTLDELPHVVDKFSAASRLYGDLIAFGALECSH